MLITTNTTDTTQLRDGDRDALQAVNAQITERESVGAGATQHLLEQKAGLEAKLGIAPEVKPEARPAEPAFERKDLDPAPEQAVPRRPGRPRKPTE